jgi:mycoredoxin
MPMNNVAQTIILYGHEFCPAVPPVIGMLRLSKVPYEYRNIHQDEAARRHVRSLNNGNESVPTLVFPDGSHLTEPSGRALAHKLNSLGYRVPPQAWVSAYTFQLLIFGLIVWGLLSFWGWP